MRKGPIFPREGPERFYEPRTESLDGNLKQKEKMVRVRIHSGLTNHANYSPEVSSFLFTAPLMAQQYFHGTPGSKAILNSSIYLVVRA